MATETLQQPAPTPEHQRLSPFAGTWNTRGQVRTNASDPPDEFHATDTYEWLPGGFFLVHRWNAHMPGGNTQGIEIIGYDAASKNYVLYAFDSQGNTSTMQAEVQGDTWTFTGGSVRFTGTFRDGGTTLAGVWERRANEGSKWMPWMDVTLAKLE